MSCVVCACVFVTSEDHTYQLMNPGIYTVGLEPDETIFSLLHFKPTEVR